MKLKNGVNPEGVCREIWWALGIVNKICEDWFYEMDIDADLVVTSLRDGKHSAHSKHYIGNAADIRTRDIPYLSGVESLFHEIKGSIDCYGFDTVLEKDHIHIEWDPKGGENFLTFTA